MQPAQVLQLRWFETTHRVIHILPVAAIVIVLLRVIQEWIPLHGKSQSAALCCRRRDKGRTPRMP